MFLAFTRILFSQAKYKKDLTSVDRNWKNVNALKKQSSKLTRVNEFPGKFILVLPSESPCFEYLLKSNVGNESLLPLVLDRKHCCSYSFHIYCWFAETFGNISSLHLCLLTQQISIDKLLWGSTRITLLMEKNITLSGGPFHAFPIPVSMVEETTLSCSSTFAMVTLSFLLFPGRWDLSDWQDIKNLPFTGWYVQWTQLHKKTFLVCFKKICLKLIFFVCSGDGTFTLFSCN